jgi:hypothetical protein
MSVSNYENRLFTGLSRPNSVGCRSRFRGVSPVDTNIHRALTAKGAAATTQPVTA